MLKYIYIDESGDLGSQSRHLVITALIVDDPSSLERIVKKMRRHKFKKELRKASEIRANNSGDDLRRHMLEKLNEIPNIKIFSTVLDKRKLYSEFLKSDKNKQYNFVAGKLAYTIPLSNSDLEIRIDHSKGKQFLRDDFNAYFLKKLKEKHSLGKIEIFHSYSHAWIGLQFADLLAWSTFQKFEHNNTSYLDILDKVEKNVFLTF